MTNVWSEFDCRYSEKCSGCPIIHLSYEDQKQFKLNNLRENWVSHQLPLDHISTVDYIDLGPGYLRDRTDFTITKTKKGFYERESHQLLDIESCPQMSHDLANWYNVFRKFKFPIEQGSVRLRVGPTGLRGAWLDFSNLDIKNLLEESTLLKEIMAHAVLEVGQKRKIVVEQEKLKLSDPVFHPWFETYIGEQSIPLYCSIGDFTQPSLKGNKVLVNELFKIIKNFKIETAVEFGSGIGNFTLPLAAAAKLVKVYESDFHSLESLKFNIHKNRLSNKVRIYEGDFQNIKKGRLPEFDKTDTVVVDPPRSGLKKFLDPLFEIPSDIRPKGLIYVSCFAESFCFDSKKLYDLGYVLRKLTVLDQFPQSRFYELVAYFELV